MASEGKPELHASSSGDQRTLDRLESAHMEKLIKQLEKGGYKVTREYDDSEKLSKISGESLKKTKWDIIQILGVPIVLLIIGSVFSILQNQASLQMSEQQHQTDLQIAAEQQQDTMLQTYLDKMSDLLTVDHLKDPKLGVDARSIAQARTLTVLLGLNNPIPESNKAVPGFQERKGMLLQFLYEEDLINRNNVLISLNTADLSYVQSEGTSLQNIDLSGANLSGANLNGANLSGADLSGADLSGANLSNANLSKALLRNVVLNQAALSGDNLTGADLRGAQLDSAHLEYVTLSGAKLGFADLYGSFLTSANLSGADLDSANLGSTNLDYSVLKQANLSYADLNHSQLIHTDLSDANLIHVDFNHANLTDARLNRADLDGADVSGAILTKEQITQAASSNQLIYH